MAEPGHSMIQAVVAAGVFIAVPIVGRWALGPLKSPIPVIARPSLWTCAGLAIWSVPLLGSAMLGAYRPEVIGALGWLTVTAFLAIAQFRVQLPRLGRWDVVALAGILLGAALAARYAADPFTTGRDMAVYAQHALYLNHHGRLDVPYPLVDGGLMPPGFRGYLGLYGTKPTMTVQFSHLYPVWLAQAFSVAGYGGLVVLNSLFGAISLLTVYGISRRLVPAAIAVLLTVFLAVNPAQIWTTRNTLTEVLTQALIWAGLLLLTAHLSRPHRRMGLFAGVLLGLAAVVRIDALLLVPLLLAGHALWMVVRRGDGWSRTLTWAPVYLGAVPVFAIALAYYAFFSRPYFLDLATQLRQIGLLAAVSAVLLALVHLPGVTRWAGSVLSGRVLLAALLAGLALVTAYAYYVRPALPPFALFGAPNNPAAVVRSHVEDALQNLGQYLSPPVIWAAVVGAWASFVTASRGKRGVVFVPLLVIALGFSVGYLWNQSIRPDHFWAIRRFVPVIVPAFVLFAAVGAMLGIRRLPIRYHAPIVAITAVLLLAFTWTIGAATYRVADRGGSYAGLAEFAQSLAPDATYLGLGDRRESNLFFSALYIAFDRRVIPLDVTTDVGRNEAIRRLRTATPDSPVPVVTARASEFEGLVHGVRTAETTFTRRLIETTTSPLPQATSLGSVTLISILATGLNTSAVQFGTRRSWLVPDSGLYPPERVDGRQVRWTDGHARLAIPVEGPVAPQRLSVAFGGSGPQGTNLRLVLNDISLFDDDVPPGPWLVEFPVADLGDGGVANLEIISGTFVPSEVGGSPDTRQLGVMVSGITLLPNEE